MTFLGRPVSCDTGLNCFGSDDSHLFATLKTERVSGAATANVVAAGWYSPGLCRKIGA